MATQVLASPETEPQARSQPLWPFALYALTGFTGILAEQGFEKYMALLVGATAAASSVVIFSYFLGFALGGWAIGGWLQRGFRIRPLRVYGTLELLVGLSCLAFPYGFHRIASILAPLENPDASVAMKFAVRFAFGSILILPMAALMGASFPLIAHVVDRHNQSQGRSWLRAYASNLGGAVVAAIAGAYVILPITGIRGGFWMVSGICSLVFAACKFAGRHEIAIVLRRDSADTPQRAISRECWLLLVAAFFCGFVFFALEVVWTHLIATTIGCSVYAFAAMLTSVLLGLWIGAFRSDRATIRYSGIFFLAALLLVIQLRLWDLSQIAYLVELPAALRRFAVVEIYKLAIAAILIVPSAAVLGSIYPSLLRHPALAERSFLVGYLSTGNSLGCLAGTVVGIFVLIPMVGSEWSLKLIIYSMAAIGVLFLWRDVRSRTEAVAGIVGFAVLAGLASLFHWEKLVLTSGINTYFGGVGPSAAVQGPDRSLEMISFHEDPQGGMTTVLEFTRRDNGAKERVLLSNGKFEGSDDLEKQGLAQIGFVAVPSQFTRNFDRALLIGLGTAHSALALARAGYAQIDVAEFAPGIVEAARTRFAGLNEGVLSFPNVNLKIEDGRHVLLTRRGQDYDLITIEIASIWFAGATNVYSREFYELARTRLKPGGVLQQWVQLHHISQREIASAIATARAVFPYVSFWFAGGQGMIVASMEPQTTDLARENLVAERTSPLIRRDPGSAKQIARDLLHTRVLDSGAVDRMIAALHPVINTDHNRWIEYATPRYNVSGEDWVQRNLAALRSY